MTLLFSWRAERYGHFFRRLIACETDWCRCDSVRCIHLGFEVIDIPVWLVKTTVIIVHYILDAVYFTVLSSTRKYRQSNCKGVWFLQYRVCGPWSGHGGPILSYQLGDWTYIRKRVAIEWLTLSIEKIDSKMSCAQQLAHGCLCTLKKIWCGHPYVEGHRKSNRAKITLCKLIIFTIFAVHFSITARTTTLQYAE